MSTPTGGHDDPNQGWQGNTPPPPPPPAGTAYGQPPAGYAEPQPGLGQPYGGGPVLAGFWIRFAGAVIDAILLSIVAAILGLLVTLNTFQERQGLSLVLGAAYFTYLHGSTGQSLGQKLCAIRVVDEQAGGGIDYVRAFIRWLVSLVSGFVILLGYLWMLWDPKKQTWHDKAARTLVVKT